MSKQKKTAKTAKTSKADKNPDAPKAKTSIPVTVADITQAYGAGVDAGVQYSSLRRPAAILDPAEFLHASATNSRGPELRLVSDGEEWRVQQMREAEKIDFVPKGLFRIRHRAITAKEIMWIGLAGSNCKPLTFTSRESAKEWVRREFGEAGVRSLKKNAEFRPA